MWWSYRYGTLTTPKSSPSVDRVIQTQGKTHTVETNERQASQKITTMICPCEHLYISWHSWITLFDHTSFSLFFFESFLFSRFFLHYSKLDENCYSTVAVILILL